MLYTNLETRHCYGILPLEYNFSGFTLILNNILEIKGYNNNYAMYYMGQSL